MAGDEPLATEPVEEMPTAEAARPAQPVPTGRLNRFLQLGVTATQIAARGAAEGARRALSRAEEELPHALLTAKNAQLLAARLSRLRGAAMKVGQMLSLEGDSLLPREFAQALEVLRSSAHRMPEQQVKEVLRAEYGRDFGSRFRELELFPMASASIGQVHRAVTLAGEEIVLKIQYPGVASSIESDVDNLRSLLAMTRLVGAELDLDALTREVKAELRREVDYQRELASLIQYREAMAGDERFRLPRPFPEHSTQHILALERVPGVPLLTWAATAGQADRNRVALELNELLIAEVFRFGLSQTDPNPANFFFDADSGRLVLLDFGATREVPVAVRESYRKSTQAMVRKDLALMSEALLEMGVVHDVGSQVARVLSEISLEIGEVFADQVYDFGETDIQERVKARAPEMLRFRRDVSPPHPEYMFFQRKLSGVFLLCRQLRARVNLYPLLEREGLL